MPRSDIPDTTLGFGSWPPRHAPWEKRGRALGGTDEQRELDKEQRKGFANLETKCMLGDYDRKKLDQERQAAKEAAESRIQVAARRASSFF